MLIHTRKQHPIGQGFFHTGNVSLGDARFNYVYDCGSKNRKALEATVDQYVEELNGAAIDVLFLSHLHDDHVCGLDRLLAVVRAETVVLPYLSPISRLSIIASAVFHNTVRADLISLLCDPTAWFSSRGVQRVVYINPPGEGEEPPDWREPSEGQFLTPSDDVRIPEEISGLAIDLPVSESGNRRKKKKKRKKISRRSNYDHFVVSCCKPLRITVGDTRHLLNWQFVTFVHPEGDREREFESRVEREFGSNLLHSDGFKLNHIAIREMLQDSSRREKLAACYLSIRKNLNLTSLSLYSGPLNKNSVKTNAFSNGPFVPSWYDKKPYVGLSGWSKTAWLGTGDSNLAAKNRRVAFTKHYSVLRDQVVDFCLPHHGSRKNFHSDLCEFGEFFIVSAGDNNRHKHPNVEVVSQIEPWRLHVVSENEESLLFRQIEFRQ